MARTAILTVLCALAGAHRALAQPLAALEATERGLAIDPSHEGLRHQQISLLIELGRQTEAIERYRQYVQMLKDEGLGSPAPELRELIVSIRQAVAR
jgi:DNA-binding SARP family transcriptional activator